MTETVAVACKLPHGLRLRLFVMEETYEQVIGGAARKVKVARQRDLDGVGEVVIKGTAHAHGMAPRGPVANGYVITRNVPKAFWDEWVKQNASHDAVRSGLIFAHAAAEDVRAEAKEKKDVRSGLERLDPSKLPKGIEQAEESEKPQEEDLEAFAY